MPYTDIVKARAIRRAGRACEMCGLPVSFESARFVSAHPIFGILFDQDDCCVLCEDCLADLDPVTRAEAEERPPPPQPAEELPGPTPIRPEEESASVERQAPDQEAATAESEAEGARTKLPRAAREAWFPERGPDDDLCA